MRLDEKFCSGVWSKDHALETLDSISQIFLSDLKKQ